MMNTSKGETGRLGLTGCELGHVDLTSDFRDETTFCGEFVELCASIDEGVVTPADELGLRALLRERHERINVFGTAAWPGDIR